MTFPYSLRLSSILIQTHLCVHVGSILYFIAWALIPQIDSLGSVATKHEVSLAQNVGEIYSYVDAGCLLSEPQIYG